MVIQDRDLHAVDEYRVKVAEVGQLREQVGALIEQSKVTGDIDAANKLFDELSLRTAELNSLRQTIGRDPAAKLLLTYVVRFWVSILSRFLSLRTVLSLPFSRRR
jgi:hypothetical protein